MLRTSRHNYGHWLEEDLLQCHRTLAHDLNADPVVRVTGDCPLIPPDEIDRLLEEHATNEARYTTNLVEDMPLGTGVDVIDRDALDEVAVFDEDHPAIRMRESPEECNLVFSSNDRWSGFASAHVAVDTSKHYWILSDAIEAVEVDPMTVIQWVAGEDI